MSLVTSECDKILQWVFEMVPFPPPCFPPISSGLACYGGISLNPFWLKATKKNWCAEFRVAGVAWNLTGLVRPRAHHASRDEIRMKSIRRRIITLELLLMEENLHQFIWKMSHYLQGFIHPRWCKFSSINSESEQMSNVSKNPNRFQISRKESGKVQPKESKIHNSKRRTRTTSTKTNCK